VPTEHIETKENISSTQHANWSGVLAMTLCVFALIASEFLPVSLLTPMAKSLNISEGLAGYGLAISGVFAVVTSLSISMLAGSMDRKTLLLWLTSVMALSALIVSIATSYVFYMAGRALIGIVVGGFWSMSAATAIRLVPVHQVPRALAIFNGGNALATVVAAPLGSYLGGIIGWQGAFFSLIPVVLMVLFWLWTSLPTMQVSSSHQSHSASVTGLLKRPLIALGMLGVGVFFMGQFVLFTYLRPFLESVTRIDVPLLSLILLGMGVAGFLGTIVIGAFLKNGLYRTLTVIPVLMAAIGLLLIVFGHSLFAVCLLLMLWGLIATSAPIGWWTWLAQTLPKDAEAGGGLMVAVIQMSIAIGSSLGGLLVDHDGFTVAFATSAALLILASILAWLTQRSSKR
jgi:predicted MFS family arabinose efflux permease